MPPETAPGSEQEVCRVAATTIAYSSIDERKAHGEEARKRTPPSAHSGWKPAADRPDPVALLEEQDATRMPGLVPVRRGRMMGRVGCPARSRIHPG